MRPIYCSNFDYETRQADLQHVFSQYGEIARIDRKLGYAFVYFKDELNARDAIRHLNNTPFGNGRQRLTVEWAKGDRGRHHGGSGSNPTPIKTLFVINFDPVHTRDFDIKRHFERYGKIRSVRINRNYAFVRFETQEGATKALQCTHLSKIFDRVISVEYASVEDDEGRYDNDSPRGDYGRREDGAFASRRSRSPAHRRIRSSPEYGMYTGPSSGPRTRSPDSERYRRGDYGRHEYGSSRRSLSPAHRRHIRSSPDYGRYTGPSSGPRTRSPDSVTYRRGDYGRHEHGSSRRSLSPAHRRHIRSSPDYGRYTGPSSGPRTRSPESPDSVRYRRGDYGRHEHGSSRRSPSPAYRRSSPEYGRYAGPSSGPSTSSTDRVRYRSRSPVRRWRN